MSDIRSSDWSVTAANNNQTVPNGAPEGWFPSQVNNWGRETMAAVKRWWRYATPSEETTGGTGGAFAATFAATIGAYAAGDAFCVRAHQACSGTSTFNVNGTGARTIKKYGSNRDLESGDFATADVLCLAYDPTNDVFQMLAPVPESDVYTPIADLSATSTAATSDLIRVSNGTDEIGITKGNFLGNVAGNGRLLQRTVYDAAASGTHTFDANCANYLIRIVGGGAAGGGTQATGSGQNAEGSGGGGGSYVEWYGAKPAATLTYTVGAGGTGATNSDGGDGGTSTAADGTNTFTCPPGLGGEVGSAGSGSIRRIGGDGGGFPTAPAGAITINGARGFTGFVSGGIYLASGFGAASALGPGGQAGENSIGGNGKAPGSGGGGATNAPSQGARAGGGGVSGIIIIEEYS